MSDDIKNDSENNPQNETKEPRSRFDTLRDQLRGTNDPQQSSSGDDDDAKTTESQDPQGDKKKHSNHSTGAKSVQIDPYLESDGEQTVPEPPHKKINSQNKELDEWVWGGWSGDDADEWMWGGRTGSPTKQDETQEFLNSRSVSETGAAQKEQVESNAEQSGGNDETELQPNNVPEPDPDKPTGVGSGHEESVSAAERIWNQMGPGEPDAAHTSSGRTGSSKESRRGRSSGGRIWNEIDTDHEPDEPGSESQETVDPIRQEPELESEFELMQTDPDPPIEAGSDSEPDSESRWSDLEESTKAETAAPEDVDEGPRIDQRERSIDGLEEVNRATNSARVFGLGPTNDPVSEVISSKFLVGEQGARDALFISFDASPVDWQAVCRRSDEWSGGNIGVIRVGRPTRGDQKTTEIADELGAESVTIKHVPRADELSKLGIVATKLLSKLEQTPRQTVVYFHTLSAIHQHIGTKNLFRFLNTLHSRLSNSDTIGYYQMNPELHDEIVIETLRPLFETVIRFSTEGNLTVE